METSAWLLTVELAAATTLILLLLAIPLAGWIAQGGGARRVVVQALVALPLVLPPTVLGFALLVGLGPLTLPGRLIARALGHPLAFSFAGLLAGSLVYSLPFAVQPLVAGFRASGESLREAAAGLGASPVHAFATVVLPQSLASVVAAAILTFTHTVGEFGVVLMLGGNLPGRTRTISIVLYDEVQDFRYRTAAQTALLLLALSTVALAALYARAGLSTSAAAGHDA